MLSITMLKNWGKKTEMQKNMLQNQLIWIKRLNASGMLQFKFCGNIEKEESSVTLRS